MKADESKNRELSLSTGYEAGLSAVSDEPDSRLIGELLRTLRVSAKVFTHVSCCGSWNLSNSRSRKCTFHLVARGACLMHLKDRMPERLEEGDLVVLPREGWHEVCALPLPLAEAGEAGAIVCGYFEFGDATADIIVDALPDVVVVRAHQHSEAERIAGVVRLIAAETHPDQSSAFVLDKLAEALFTMVLRAHLQSLEEKRGFLAALADPRLASALAAMHREPDRDWHVGTLAKLANMSRTAFASRFADAVGMPPIQYLAESRMRRAAVFLQDRRNSVATVASHLGYRSEAAFRRAFKRLTAHSPGEIRGQYAAKRLPAAPSSFRRHPVSASLSR